MKANLLAVIVVLLTSLVSRSLQANYRYNLTYYINELVRAPIYVDSTYVCPKLFYGAYSVAKNCSSLNLASNYSILTTDTYYVTELILSNNNFGANLPYTEINAYDSLDYLDLSMNRINEFTNDLLMIDCSANYLKEINLNYNLFSRFPVFNRTCGCLRALRLNNNKNLVVLDNPLVYMNNITRAHPSLIYLDLANCSIQYINWNNYTLLYHFPSLAYLNLYGNQIKMIYGNPFLWAPPLQYLTFEGNQIQCTVDILWVKYYLLNKLPPQILTILPNGSVTNIPYRPTCFSILTNNTQDILNLTNSSFYTSIYLWSSLGNNSVIKINAGKTIDLDCWAYSIPPPDLWWTFDDRVLDRVDTTGSSYELIQNFNSTFNPYNKTSVLRIKNTFDKLSGVYSCKATYMNMSRTISNISALFFNVGITGGGDSGGLSPGAIAGIVIGSLIAFLIACCLLALCIWCCCFQLGWCLWCCFCCPCCARWCRCCPGASGAASKREATSSKSRLYSSGRYDTTTTIAPRRVIDVEEKQSGFDDLTQRSRPNYVINSISKSTSSLGDIHQTQIIDPCKSGYQLSSNEFYQIAPVTVDAAASSSSWRIPKPTTTTTHYHEDVIIDEETHVYNCSSRAKQQQQQNPYVISNQNEGFIGDSFNNLANTTHHHQMIITPPGSPKLGSGNYSAVNKRYVETNQFSQNRYVPSPLHQQSGGEMINENYFNQVVVDDEEHTYTTTPASKQYRNIPITVTNSTSQNNNNAISTSYPKYDSDV